MNSVIIRIGDHRGHRGRRLRPPLKYPGADSTAYPGESAMSRWAESQCTAAFSGYIGVAYSRSSLTISYFTPTSDGWGGGDHVVNCIVGTEPPANLTSSLKGSNR
jgi:hypothetical protein